MVVYLNGKWVPHGKAFVSVDDHGFLYGDGVYETLRVYQGRVFLGHSHMERLLRSARGIKLGCPLTSRGLERAVQQLIDKNRFQDAVVRITLTRGPGPYGFDTKDCGRPTLVMVARPFKLYPSHYHSRGVTAALVSVRRNHVLATPPHIKSTSCLNGVLAKMEAVRLGALEGMMLSAEGALTEGTVSNIFLVKKGRLLTPQLEGTLLAGCTRGFVLNVAKRLGIAAQEKRLLLKDAREADELFLTNTTFEILPVRRLIINGRDAKTHRPLSIFYRRRPVTDLLQRHFHAPEMLNFV